MKRSHYIFNAVERRFNLFSTKPGLGQARIHKEKGALTISYEWEIDPKATKQGNDRCTRIDDMRNLGRIFQTYLSGHCGENAAEYMKMVSIKSEKSPRRKPEYVKLEKFILNCMVKLGVK